MDTNFNQKFLTNTDDTGRFIVTSQRTGRVYYVEPIDKRQATDWTKWGSIDPATGKIMNKHGFRKYAGAIEESESLITKENGFEKIHELEPGVSPLHAIEVLDAKYPDKE